MRRVRLYKSYSRTVVQYWYLVAGVSNLLVVVAGTCSATVRSMASQSVKSVSLSGSSPEQGKTEQRRRKVNRPRETELHDPDPRPNPDLTTHYSPSAAADTISDPAAID
jgi:hypothetical protein